LSRNQLFRIYFNLSPASWTKASPPVSPLSSNKVDFHTYLIYPIHMKNCGKNPESLIGEICHKNDSCYTLDKVNATLLIEDPDKRAAELQIISGQLDGCSCARRVLQSINDYIRSQANH